MSVWEPHKLTLFQGKLTWPFPSRLISRLLKEGDTLVTFICIPSMFFHPIEYPYFIPLLNPRSFFQWYMTVLDVCAVTIRVGKMFRMLWSSFVCLRKWSHVAIMQIRDPINHTINPIGMEEYNKGSSGPRTSSSYRRLDADDCRLVNFPSCHHGHIMVLQLLAIFSFHLHHLKIKLLFFSKGKSASDLFIAEWCTWHMVSGISRKPRHWKKCI